MRFLFYDMSRQMTKPTKWHVRPVKTQINLGIGSVWSVFAVRMKKAYPLSVQRRLISLGGCPGWSESSLGAQSFCCFCHEVAHIINVCLWFSDSFFTKCIGYNTNYWCNYIGKSDGHQYKWAATWQNQQSECAPSKDSDQPGHLPSLIRVFAVRLMGSYRPKLSSCGQRRLWSDWVDAQADLNLRWAHTYFVGFVMSRLISYCNHYIL